MGAKNPNYFDLNQLYDLSKDAYELSNVYSKPNYTKVKVELEEELKKYLSATPQFKYGEYSR